MGLLFCMHPRPEKKIRCEGKGIPNKKGRRVL